MNVGKSFGKPNQSACLFVSVGIKYRQRLHQSNGMRTREKNQQEQ